MQSNGKNIDIVLWFKFIYSDILLRISLHGKHEKSFAIVLRWNVYTKVNYCDSREVNYFIVKQENLDNCPVQKALDPYCFVFVFISFVDGL